VLEKVPSLHGEQEAEPSVEYSPAAHATTVLV
jgi:hypothetical protein